MSALDFSHFKKTGQDKKCATLMHPDGHEIKIAIAGLSPALKKKLESLPLHQAEGSRNPIAPMDDQSPAVADDPVVEEPAIEQGALEEVAATPPASAPVPAQPVATPQAPAPVAAAPVAPPVAPEPAPAPVAQEAAPEPTVEELAAQRDKQDLDFANDLHAGHVKPETYRSLFDKKDTLGKIGTLFGLMVSGAGAGLTHQPNALMAMMDKQIQNDLEAQKTNQSNKQSWYKLQIEHTRNQAMNNLTNSDAAKNWTENQRERFINANQGIIDGMGTFQTENNMLIGGIQDQQNAINKMPDGPQRQASQNSLNTLVIPTALKKIQENNMKAAGLQHELMGKAKTMGSNQPFNPPPEKGPADPNKYYSAVNSQKLDEGIQRGRLDPRMPNAIPPGEVPALMDEQKALEAHRDTYANAKKAFDVLNDMKNAGQIPAAAGLAGVGAAAGSAFGPVTAGLGSLIGKKAGESVAQYYERARNIYVDNLIGQLDRSKSEEERRKIAQGMLPAWNDDATSRKAAHNELFQQFAADPREKAPYLTRYGVKTPMPKYAFNPSKVKNTVEELADTIKGVGESTAGTKGGKEEDGIVNTIGSWFKPNKKVEKNALGFTK